MSSQGPRQLVSWKEIADYLDRDVRTVVRWEKDKGLPVHRVPGGKRQAVYAYPDELDRWLRGEPEAAQAIVADASTAAATQLASAPISVSQRRIRRAEWALLIAVVLICFSVLGFLFRPQPPPEEPLRLVRINTEPGTVWGATLSPDGREVAYTFRRRGESKWFVYIQLIGAGDPVRVTKGDSDEGAPAWSPDGRYLAFATVDDAGDSLVMVPALGGAPRVVSRVHDRDSAFYVDWTPDGKGLVYTDRDAEGEAVSTWIFHLDTGQRTRFLVPPDPMLVDYAGRFSPDGKYFAFMRGTSIFAARLYVMPAGGGEPRELISDTVAGAFTWTADSREIILQRPDGRDTMSLARISVSGGDLRPAVPSTISALYPSTSRTGKGLTYLQYQDDVNIWRVDVDAKKPAVKPVVASLERDVDPACSPDMKHLAFLSYRNGGGDLWISDTYGADPRRLTFQSGTSVGNSGTPDWSPDGHSLAFSVFRNRQSDVAVMEVNATEVRYLTSHPAWDGFPRWSHDGRFLYFTSDRTGRNEIWKMDADGSNPVQVTHNGGYVAQESSDGKYLYYGKFNANGIWRMPLSGGPEELVVAELPRRFAWSLSDKGIYFVNGNTFPGMTIHFYSFATGKASHVFEPDRFLQYGPAKLSTCRDGRTLFVTQADVLRSDLIWAENFK